MLKAEKEGRPFVPNSSTKGEMNADTAYGSNESAPT